MMNLLKKIVFKKLFRNILISLTIQLILMEKHSTLSKLFGLDLNKMLMKMNTNHSMNSFLTPNSIININYTIQQTVH